MKHKIIVGPGYGTRYRILDSGIVQSSNYGEWRDVSLCLNKKHKYHMVYLWNSDLQKKSVQYLHRLLATAFIENPHGLPCVNHKDGNKLNNKLDNLEWCTHVNNSRHAWETGLCSPIKLTESQVLEIANSDELATKICKRFGVSHVLVYKIRNKQVWKRITAAV